MVQKFGWIVAVLSLVLAGAAVARNTKQTIDQQHYSFTQNEAKVAWADGDWTSAEKHYRELVKQNPKDGQSWFMVGFAVHYQGRFDEARDLFLYSKDLGGDPGLVHYNVACGYAQQGQTHKALEQLRIATENGFCQADWAEEDPDLAPLRTNEQFQNIVDLMRK